jgi:hypothetical protein
VHLDLGAFRAKITNADMTGSAFDARWSSLPLSLRIQLSLILPAYIVYLLLFGARQTLAENIALEDMPSWEKILFENDDWAPLDSLLIDERDRMLLGRIKRVYESGGNRTVGVIYGARHMRNAVDFLLRSLNSTWQKPNGSRSSSCSKGIQPIVGMRAAGASVVA